MIVMYWKTKTIDGNGQTTGSGVCLHMVHNCCEPNESAWRRNKILFNPDGGGEITSSEYRTIYSGPYDEHSHREYYTLKRCQFCDSKIRYKKVGHMVFKKWFEECKCCGDVTWHDELVERKVADTYKPEITMHEEFKLLREKRKWEKWGYDEAEIDLRVREAIGEIVDDEWAERQEAERKEELRDKRDRLEQMKDDVAMLEKELQYEDEE